MKLDLRPLQGQGRGEAIVVANLRVGDAAEAVARAALTGAEETNPGEPRSYARGTVFRIGPDGAEIEVPLAERVEAVIRSGGWLRCGQVALRVESGRIARIFVRGRALDSLEIASEDDIARWFGPADGHERTMGQRIHHYPSRNLAVAWDSRGSRLDHVALGPDPWIAPTLGAKELLAELLRGFEVLRAAEWSAPADGSARVRYQRITALAQALGLGTPGALVAGQFLKGELRDSRKAVVQEIAARGPRAADSPHLPHWLFSHLLQYRNDVNRVVRATTGWLECSDPGLLGMIITQNQIGAQIEALMVDIDRWLCTLMAPAGQTFALTELIARHGWPDVDLEAMETDEL